MTSDQPGSAGVPEHNILPRGASPWRSDLLETEQEYRVVVTAPGEYTYLCVIHEALGMVGRLTVVDRQAGR